MSTGTDFLNFAPLRCFSLPQSTFSRPDFYRMGFSSLLLYARISLHNSGVRSTSLRRRSKVFSATI